MKKRCDWAKKDIDIIYHDNEWCIPSHDDKYIFEMLILEGFQAGLSWNTILNKRENFRTAFDDFDYNKIINYDENKVNSLLNNKGIIRNRLKINALITNAKAFTKIQKEFKTFSEYIWKFTDNKVIDNKLTDTKLMPTHNLLSDEISLDLKKRGFKFVGTTIIYSFLQAIGMIDDHLITCEYKHKQKEK